MRLGLLGFPVTHSRSPDLYHRFLGASLTSYILYSIKSANMIPNLNYFRQHLDGLSITAPYKKHFFHQTQCFSPLVTKLESINCIALGFNPASTNTDLEAVMEILQEDLKNHKLLQIILLGDGSMAQLTTLVASHLGIPLVQFSRKTSQSFSELDLSSLTKPNHQTIVINACSRNFIFRGKLTGEEIFWDYNYAFAPHLHTLPSKVKFYRDGLSLLELQARAAIRFWKTHMQS